VAFLAIHQTRAVPNARRASTASTPKSQSVVVVGQLRPASSSITGSAARLGVTAGIGSNTGSAARGDAVVTAGVASTVTAIAGAAGSTAIVDRGATSDSSGIISDAPIATAQI
jgi:hypothetical protein